MNLSDNLKKIRKEHNLSQEDLAEKLGVSRQSVSKWESNQAYPEMDKVIQICKMFNLNMDELLNQDINETKDREIRKNSFNKQVDSFLNFVTKTVNMFSSMRFRDIIKCLFEQVLLVLIAIFVFFIYATIISHILNTIDIIPFKIRDFMEMVLHICYLCVVVVVLLYIFKIRYLDYYKIVDKEDINKELENEIKEDKKENVVIKKQFEKIIIRDPEKSSAGFFNLLARIIIVMFKAFIALLILPFIACFVGIVILIVLSFLFVKTGTLFIGCLVGGVGALLLNSLVIIISYNYIFNGRFKWNRYLYEFLLSLILGGIGIGLIFIGIKNFNVLDYDNEKYYSKESQYIDLKNNLTIYYYNAQFVETNSNEIKVELIKPNFSQSKLYYDTRSRSVYVNQDDYNYMKVVRYVINVINDKYIFNDIDTRVLIYANKDNIEKIQIKR